MSLSTCFNWEEAHLIANANFMVDRNKTTKAESGSVARQNKVACPIEGDAKGRMALPGATEDQLKALPEFRYAE